MPESSREPRPAVLSRRALLAWAAATPALSVLAACTRDDPPDERPSGDTPPTTPYVDPDADARARAVAASAALVGRYEALLRRPDADETLTATLGTVLGNHRQHLAALGVPAAGTTPTTPPTTGTTSTASPTSPTAGGTTATTPPATTPAGTIADAVAEVVAAERGASNATAGDAIRASDGEFAQLLASIAACQSVHAAVLRPFGDAG